MDQSIQSNKNKNVLIYATIAVLLGLAVGYYLGTNLKKSKAKQSRQVMFKEVFANIGFANNLSGKILEISSDKKSLIVEVPGVYGLNPSKKYQKRKVFSSIEVQPQQTGSMTFLKSEVQRLILV